MLRRINVRKSVWEVNFFLKILTLTSKNNELVKGQHWNKSGTTFLLWKSISQNGTKRQFLKKIHISKEIPFFGYSSFVQQTPIRIQTFLNYLHLKKTEFSYASLETCCRTRFRKLSVFKWDMNLWLVSGSEE